MVLSGVLLVYLLLPLVGLVSRLSVVTSRDWLDPEVLGAVSVSVETATIAVLLLALFGIPLAYLLARREFPGKAFVNLLVYLPLAVPPVVSGILLLLIFGPYAPAGAWLAAFGLPLTDNLPAIVVAQTFVASPFLVVAARSAFESVDTKLEQAAATLGDSPWVVFRRVTLPLAWPAILGGLTLSWVRALGEFGATIVLAYHPYSLPILAWVRFSGSGLDSTLPLVLLLFLVAAAGLALSQLLARFGWSSSTIDRPSRR
jgi:molybdate/tungstate transport system permease protein